MRLRPRGTERLAVALVAPPWYSVPPDGYGGIESVIYLLADELAKLGHHVTVFGRQGPYDEFEAVALAPETWASELGGPKHEARELTYLHAAYRHIKHRAFDVVHEHSGYAGMLLASLLDLQSAAVATVHGALEEADGQFLAAVARRVEVVSISRAQRATVAGVRWAATVHNAVDASALRLGRQVGDYLVDLARICPDKGQHVAIEVARRAGLRLVLAGKVAEGSEEYFEREVRPHLGAGVEWRENVSGRAKAELLAGAAAMLFPIQWEEPFGLAMVEAMASGTPVVATPRGAAVELVEEGVTGCLAGDAEGLVEAVERAREIDREACAAHARERFSPRRTAEDYLAVYLDAIARRRDRVLG